MTVTIGTFTTSRLTFQPFGYEGDPRDGLTARTFRIGGLLTAAQWQALISEYNTWRNLRITDEDTLSSGTVGTTINLTLGPANGLTVTALPCWFVEAPSGDQVGPYINATVTLVDAAQALEVLLRSEEKDRERREDLPDLGTVTLGSAVITLTAPPDTRRDIPTVALTATGASLISGPLAAHKAKQIAGFISTGTYNDLLTWFDTTISTVPTAGTLFPVEEPQADAEIIIDNGVKSTRFNVTLAVVEIR